MRGPDFDRGCSEGTHGHTLAHVGLLLWEHQGNWTKHPPCNFLCRMVAVGWPKAIPFPNEQKIMLNIMFGGQDCETPIYRQAVKNSEHHSTERGALRRNHSIWGLSSFKVPFYPTSVAHTTMVACGCIRWPPTRYMLDLGLLGAGAEVLRAVLLVLLPLR